MESESESESDWEVIKIPSYDKGAFNGIGDRSNDKYYTLIESPIDIIIFEGWFNGFYSLDPTILQLKYLTSSPSPTPETTTTTTTTIIYHYNRLNYMIYKKSIKFTKL